MIKRAITLLALVACLITSVSYANTADTITPSRDQSISTVLITRLIEQHHYKDTVLDDAQSQAVLNQYIKSLDPNRTFFTQKDIVAIQRFDNIFDDSLKKGELEPAFAIFHLFNKRRVERADFALELLDYDFNFELDETYQFDREDLPWAKDTTELNNLWRKRVKNDVLTLSLTHKTDLELKDTLRKRYERLKTRSEQFKAEDVYELFINAYLKTVEPHTSYFSPRTSENFKINMSLSLEGIGAVLKTEDDYTTVQRIVPGGPADLGGLLHAEDRITGVAQGKDGKIEDVVGWRLDDVVDLIRGPKDSIVRLQILPHQTGVSGASEEITIVRNKIKLEEQQVQKSIQEIQDGDTTRRIGVIDIPTFYMDFEARARGDKDFRSTTRDTKVLIDELMAEGIDGLIVDLRGNGGGSLPEAVALTGLFIKSGPVVQIKDNTGSTETNDDDDKTIAYNGPLAVLVDNHSASASEIFSGAIKDYGRGIILGKPTFGKGTVQTVIDLNRFVRESDTTLGQLKITMAQFFRVNGDSTQHRGVIPDIIFPTAEESANQGESSLDNALPWANIPPAKFSRDSHADPDLSIANELHQQRITKDSGFQFLQAQLTDRKTMLDQKVISLKKKDREQEREVQKQQQLERNNTFRLSRGLAPLPKDNEDGTENELSTEDKEAYGKEINLIELREAAHILVDLTHPAISTQELMSQQAAQANPSH